MQKQKTVVILSDLHCGHLAGLTPPQNFVNKKDLPQLYSLQDEMWRRYVGLVKKYKNPDLLICNGDAIDGKGDKTGGTELITTDRIKQSNIASYCLDIFCAKKIIMTYGTPYHTGKGEDYETNVAKNLGCEIHNHAQIDVNGCVLDIKHHCGGSAVPYGRHTAPAKERLWNLLWEDADSCVRANIIIRSHVHFYNFCGGNDWLAFTTPALQAPSHNKYGGRRCSGIIDWGIVVFNIDNKGDYRWQTEIVRLESARAELIRV